MSFEGGGNGGNDLNVKKGIGIKSEDLLNSLQAGESGKLKEELIGKEDLLINELKEHCTRIEEGKVLIKKKGKFIVKETKTKEDILSGLQGKIVHFQIPATGNFNGFSLDAFISESAIGIDKSDFDHQKCEKVAYSMEDIANILNAVRKFMNEYGVKIDTDMDYSTDLREREDKKRSCRAGDALRKIFSLKDGVYRLSDRDKEGKRVRLSSFNGNSFHFQKTNKDYASGNVISKF